MTPNDDEELRARVLAARARDGRSSPRWAAVCESFGVTSFGARVLCDRFGIDADEWVGGKPASPAPSTEGLWSRFIRSTLGRKPTTVSNG
jgi:hypothetical protein